MIRRRMMLGEEETMRKWTTDGIADRSEPNGDIVIGVTNIKDSAFCNCKGITSVTADNAVSIGNGAFGSCTGITKCSFPEVTTVGQTALRDISIKELILPKLRTVGYAAFAALPELQKFDFNSDVSQIPGLCFQNCKKLETLILRNPVGVELLNVNAFQGTPFYSDGAGGTIYVPQALIDSEFYITSANWSTVNGYGKTTWKPIEGSEYE